MTRSTELAVDLQVACEDKSDLPTEIQLHQWALLALETAGFKERSAEVTIRIVDETEIVQLNSEFRHKNKPTNVLSFPFEQPIGMTLPLLGDIVICKQVMQNESVEQDKALFDHWAHLIVHGTLHLLGFDHIDEAEAQEMEALEVQILNNLGIDDPYRDHQ